MNEKNKIYYASTTASKIFSIMNCFTIKEPEHKVSDLSKKLNIARSSIYRMLLMLEHEEILEKNEDTGAYYLSIHMLDYSASVLSRMEIRRHGQFELEQLVQKTGLDANLSILYKADSMSIAFALSSEHENRFYNVVGRRAPAHITAMGKSMLAMLPREKVYKLIKEYGWRPYTANSIQNYETLDKELDAIAKNGYSIDDGEADLYIMCVAAVVLEKNGQIAGAISLSGDRQKVSENLENNKKLIIEHARRLSQRLGYN